jgi:multidrug efflux pump subunit AcrB
MCRRATQVNRRNCHSDTQTRKSAVNISRPFIERPIAIALIVIGLVLPGIVAYGLLPIASLPQVDFPTIQVEASLPGASAENIAATVATPLERQFGLIPALTQMTSTSTLGSTSVTLQFDLSRNIDGAAQDVQSAINAAGGLLPKNLPNPPTYHKVNPAQAKVLTIAATSDTLPLRVVDGYADTFLWTGADLANSRRRLGRPERRAEAGNPRSDRPGQGSLPRPQSRKYP